jgi:acetyl-CoA acetyltransferase family protein
MYDTSLGWRFQNPRLAKRFPLEGMGVTAENIAERWEISRESQDAFALESQTRAARAQDAGHFDSEIIPFEVKVSRKETALFSSDESVRRTSTLDALARLKPVFKEGGSVTAGNSSPLNDGAAAILLASEEAVKTHGLQPIAQWRGGAAAGVDPRIMGIGPVPATKRALSRVGLSLKDIERFELNEAFAVQSLAVIQDLELDPALVNPTGGAIAIGHPLGASGARILTTLLYGLQRDEQRFGVATMCIGVGQGIATVIERC